LQRHLDGLAFANPAFPVVSNVSAAPVHEGNAARELLVRQLMAPVRWSASIAEIVRAGTQRFVELGPGAVLCGLNKRNARGLSCASLRAPADLEAFA
jgi:[acyl-carrier-protein] S-malonyltransferase